MIVSNKNGILFIAKTLHFRGLQFPYTYISRISCAKSGIILLYDKNSAKNFFINFNFVFMIFFPYFQFSFLKKTKNMERIEMENSKTQYIEKIFAQ